MREKDYSPDGDDGIITREKSNSSRQRIEEARAGV